MTQASATLSLISLEQVEVFGPRDAVAAALYGASLPAGFDGDPRKLPDAPVNQTNAPGRLFKVINESGIDPTGYSNSPEYIAVSSIESRPMPCPGPSGQAVGINVKIVLNTEWHIARGAHPSSMLVAWSRKNPYVVIGAKHRAHCHFLMGGQLLLTAKMPKVPVPILDYCGDALGLQSLKPTKTAQLESVASRAKAQLESDAISATAFNLAFRDYPRAPGGELADVLGLPLSRANQYLAPSAGEAGARKFHSDVMNWCHNGRPLPDESAGLSLLESALLTDVDAFGLQELPTRTVVASRLSDFSMRLEPSIKPASLPFWSEPATDMSDFGETVRLALPRLDPERLMSLCRLAHQHEVLAEYIASAHGFTINGDHIVAFMAAAAPANSQESLGVQAVLKEIGRQRGTLNPDGTLTPGGFDPDIDRERRTLNALRASGSPDAWKFLLQSVATDPAAAADELTYIAGASLRRGPHIQAFLETFGAAPYGDLPVDLIGRLTRQAASLIASFAGNSRLLAGAARLIANPSTPANAEPDAGRSRATRRHTP